MTRVRWTSLGLLALVGAVALFAVYGYQRGGGSRRVLKQGAVVNESSAGVNNITLIDAPSKRGEVAR